MNSNTANNNCRDARISARLSTSAPRQPDVGTGAAREATTLEKRVSASELLRVKKVDAGNQTENELAIASPIKAPRTYSRRTGTCQRFERVDGTIYWRARIALADGERRWLVGQFVSEQDARQYAARATVQAQGFTLALFIGDEGGAGAMETCDEYFGRLADARRAKGIGSVRTDVIHWKKWISPSIGSRPMRSITPRDIEDIRNLLDHETEKRTINGLKFGLSQKTAANIWSIVRTTFKEAVAARKRALQILSVDPSAGVKPPEKSRSSVRHKTFLLPNEFLQLINCVDVPLEARRVYAFLTYTYLRPSEAHALLWSDIDLAAGNISITKSMNSRTSEVNVPKTAAGVRLVPIEETLRPLLEVMYKEREGDSAPALPALRSIGEQGWLRNIRKHLKAAGLTRAAIWARTMTQIPMNFRSLRDTGISWLALAHHLPYSMMRWAGHEEYETTHGYIKVKFDYDTKIIGIPFPPLPASVLGASHS